MDNPPDPRPVFEADQVLTIYDLEAIRNGYIYQYQHTPRYRLLSRFMFRAGVGTCDSMIQWLRGGKLTVAPDCSGGHE